MSGVWYKRNPSDFLYGVKKLSAEERGVYATLLEMFYDEGGMIAGDNRAYLAGQCGCSTRKLNVILKRLIDAGKIILHEGYLTNKRVLSQLKPEFMSRLSRDKREIILSKLGENNDLTGGKNTQEAQETPNPLKGDGPTASFDDFWKAFPNGKKRASHKARSAWLGLTMQDRAAALAGLAGYAAGLIAKGREGVTPAVYLRDRWFEDIAPDVAAAPSAGTPERRAYDAVTKDHGAAAWRSYFTSGVSIEDARIVAANPARRERLQDRFAESLTRAGFAIELREAA